MHEQAHQAHTSAQASVAAPGAIQAIMQRASQVGYGAGANQAEDLAGAGNLPCGADEEEGN